MKGTLRIAGVLFAFMILLTACGERSARSEIWEELEIDVSKGLEISRFDTHGGFHYDGILCIVLQFSDNSILRQIEESGRWEKCPMDGDAKILAYGISEETVSAGPYLTDREGNTLVPKIEEGYYLLIDRQDQAAGEEEEGIWKRPSLNFTLGVYDAEAGRLYFCKMDT